MNLRDVLWICAFSCCAVLALPGCGEKAGDVKMAACPGCGMEMASGEFCTHCQMVASGETGTVHCDKCDTDMPVGTYCKTCNAFMIKGDATCPGCGMTMKAGAFCEHCNKYGGLPKVAYCPTCKAPSPADGCPVCKKS